MMMMIKMMIIMKIMIMSDYDDRDYDDDNGYGDDGNDVDFYGDYNDDSWNNRSYRIDHELHLDLQKS